MSKSTSAETPDNGRVSKTRQRIRESRGVAKDVAVAASGAGLGAALIFNRRMQQFTGRLLFGLRALSKRILGHAGQELTDAAVLGWSLFEIQWVGLATINWVLYSISPVWGWVHVTINTLWWLAFKHFEKAYMMQRVVTLLTLSGFGSIVADLDTSSRKAFWASIKKGAATAGVEMPFMSWELIRKLQNAGFYFSIGCAIGAFGMLGSFGLGWVFVPVAMISGMILWEIGSSAGNNKTANGAYCVDANEYDSIRRERDAQDKITWIVGKGRKFVLPWFQAKSQLAAAGVLAAVVLFSWTVAFVYRGDSDRDGLSNKLETRVYHTQPNRWDSRIKGISDRDAVLDTDSDGVPNVMEIAFYKTDPLNADSDGDGILDGDEIKLGLNPHGPGSIIDVPPKTSLGSSLSAGWLSWLTNPTPAQQEVWLKIQNWTNLQRWATQDSGTRQFVLFWLLPAGITLLIIASLFGARWWKSPGFMCFLATIFGWVYIGWPLWLWGPAMFAIWLAIKRRNQPVAAPAH